MVKTTVAMKKEIIYAMQRCPLGEEERLLAYYEVSEEGFDKWHEAFYKFGKTGLYRYFQTRIKRTLAATKDKIILVELDKKPKLSVSLLTIEELERFAEPLKEWHVEDRHLMPSQSSCLEYETFHCYKDFLEYINSRCETSRERYHYILSLRNAYRSF
jgi:hypothetical protein